MDCPRVEKHITIGLAAANVLQSMDNLVLPCQCTPFRSKAQPKGMQPIIRYHLIRYHPDFCKHNPNIVRYYLPRPTAQPA